MKESNIQKKIMIAVSKYSRVFRNNVGTGWTGKISPTKDGGKYIKDARPLKAGLCVGSSDLIGWTEKIVTADMIGQKIAIFTALEIKTATGKATKEQLNFIRVVKQSGGISGIARSEIEAVEIVNN